MVDLRFLTTGRFASLHRPARVVSQRPRGMHPILRIDEILAVIVTFVDTTGGGPWHHPKSTLLNVALSCKTLSEAALDQLWKEQSCLFPLLKSCDVIQERRVEQHDSLELFVRHGLAPQVLQKLCLVNEPQLDDWKNVYKYANKIKTLVSDMGTCFSHVLEPTTMAAFLNANNQRRFFPNLRSLEDPTSLCAFGQLEHFAPTFFVPSLVSMELKIFDPATHRAFTEYLAGSGRDLESISVQMEVEDVGALSVLATLRRLREFVHTGQPLDSYTWVAFRTLPNLSQLSVRLKTASPSVQLVHQVPRTHWESRLQHLHLNVPEPNSWSVYLKDVVCPELKTLTIWSSYYQPLRLQESQHLFKLIDDLIPSNRPSQLRYLNLSISSAAGTQEEWSEVFAVHPDMLRVFLRHSKMRNFTLSLHCSFNLDDAFLVSFARAFPHLEEANLAIDGVWSKPPRLTLRGLYALAQHCPELRTFQAPIDATDIPEDLISNLAEKHEHPLTSLRFHNSASKVNLDIPPENFADYLKKLFPHLRNLWTIDYDDIGDDNQEGDQDVEYWYAVAERAGCLEDQHSR